ncbi:MAG: ribosomal protein S18-alanine N-acetyltransferase [Erysipelotrichaceae bacterium]
MLMVISFRQAMVSDIDDLVLMDKAIFAEFYNADNFKYEISENPFSRNILAYEDDQLIGYIFYWLTFEQGQLIKIAVDEGYRQKGLGSQLMAMMIKDLQDNECESISLEVRVSNIVGQKFYEKNDFLVLNIRKNYYSDNNEDALLMARGL